MIYLNHEFNSVSVKNAEDNIQPHLCYKCNCYCYTFKHIDSKIYFAELRGGNRTFLFLSQEELKLNCDEYLIKQIIE